MGTSRSIWDRREGAGKRYPLARPMDTERVELALGPLTAPVCTNIGNPHATFFVADVEAIDLAALGPILEHDPLFPERANIGIAAVREARGHPSAGLGARGRDHPRLRQRRLRPPWSQRTGGDWQGAGRPLSSTAEPSTSRGARTGM